MAGRPPKEDSRDKQYRVRLNDEEDDMLSFCSEETGEAKSEIFRKALKSLREVEFQFEQQGSSIIFVG